MNTIQAIDPNTLEVTKIYEGDFNFKSNSNQYAIFNGSVVTSLVADIAEEMLYMIQYDRKLSTFEVKMIYTRD